MRKIQSFIVLVLVCCFFAACYKDKGNYEYIGVNELNFTNFDTARGYSVNIGELLTIKPQIKGSLDPDGSRKQYSYEWSLDFPTQDSVLSTEKDLGIRLQMSPGKYVLQYKVTDKETGIQFRIKTDLLVTTNVFEGWMVLNEVNGRSRLDMLSYSRINDQFEQFTDVLSRLGSELTLQGKPRQVLCMETDAFRANSQTYNIYVVTDAGTNRIDAETFGYDPLKAFRYEMTGSLPANFKPSILKWSLQYDFMPFSFLTVDNDIFIRRYESRVFPNVPVNVYTGEHKAFKAFPQISCYDDVAVIYNMDKRKFTYTQFEGNTVMDMPPDVGYPEGKEMVYMEDQYNGAGYAVMKDPGTTQFYLLNFYPGWFFTNFFEPITATDIDKATLFAVSPELGYLFYVVGGKVYEYDPFLQKSFLMLDKGNAEITYLSFQRFMNFSYFDKYTEWANLLTVGTHTPSGPEGSNGTLEQYKVPPVNAALQRVNSWTGFGKIVSVSYRERN